MNKFIISVNNFIVIGLLIFVALVAIIGAMANPVIGLVTGGSLLIAVSVVTGFWVLGVSILKQLEEINGKMKNKD